MDCAHLYAITNPHHPHNPPHMHSDWRFFFFAIEVELLLQITSVSSSVLSSKLIKNTKCYLVKFYWQHLVDGPPTTNTRTHTDIPGKVFQSKRQATTLQQAEMERAKTKQARTREKKMGTMGQSWAWARGSCFYRWPHSRQASVDFRCGRPMHEKNKRIN